MVFMGQPAGFGASSFPLVPLIRPSLEAQLPRELQLCRTKFLERNPTDFISFPAAVIKGLHKSNFRKKRLILAHSLQIQSVTTGSHGGGSWKKLVT